MGEVVVAGRTLKRVFAVRVRGAYDAPRTRKAHASCVLLSERAKREKNRKKGWEPFEKTLTE